MKRLNLLMLSALLIISAVGAANAQNAKGDSKVAALIAAITQKYPETAKFYSLVEIGSTGYLLRGSSPKVLKTKRIAAADGGMCEGYASVRIFASTARMQEQSEGEGAIWKTDGKTWKEIARTSAGDWECKDVKNIPQQFRKCLGADKCD